MRFLSTPSGWRATVGFFTRQKTYIISIHALRVEGDTHETLQLLPHSNFYPRPPGGGRPPQRQGDAKTAHFYPRPPGGGRPCFQLPVKTPLIFLSTPSGWRATPRGCQPENCDKFLSTPSGWRATPRRFCYAGGADDFYPRPPGGGRPTIRASHADASQFLSTPSGWRATRKIGNLYAVEEFLSTPSGWRATLST